MANQKESKDVILIGAGVLSTTFGSMLKEIEPDWNVKLYERLDRPGIESALYSSIHKVQRDQYQHCDVRLNFQYQDDLDVHKV